MPDPVAAECAHCWHVTGTVLTTFPGQAVDRCCHCGVTRNVWLQSAIKNPAGHGPFHPLNNSLAVDGAK